MAEQPGGAAYHHNVFWSSSDNGFHWGAYSSRYELQDIVLADHGLESLAIKAVPGDPAVRLENVVLDDIKVLAYVRLQTQPAIWRGLTFSGARSPAISQAHEACKSGDENDPASQECLRVWLRVENPVFPAGVVPFDFGKTFNKHSVWEIRGFSHPDYPALPVNFDLYRSDNQVSGGYYHAELAAWLVPRP